MVYNGNLVKINGSIIPHIKEYKIGRAKLWKDADRNMNGDTRATLIGIFPKISMKIGYLTEDEMSKITQLLDLDYFEVEWFDVRIKSTIKTKYYASDYETDMLSKKKGIYQPFDVNLVPVSKRRY